MAWGSAVTLTSLTCDPGQTLPLSGPWFPFYTQMLPLLHLPLPQLLWVLRMDHSPLEAEQGLLGRQRPIVLCSTQVCGRLPTT